MGRAHRRHAQRPVYRLTLAPSRRWRTALPCQMHSRWTRVGACRVTDAIHTGRRGRPTLLSPRTTSTTSWSFVACLRNGQQTPLQGLIVLRQLDRLLILLYRQSLIADRLDHLVPGLIGQGLLLLL